MLVATTATDYWRRGPPKRTGAAYRQTEGYVAAIFKNWPPELTASARLERSAEAWDSLVNTDAVRPREFSVLAPCAFQAVLELDLLGPLPVHDLVYVYLRAQTV